MVLKTMDREPSRSTMSDHHATTREDIDERDCVELRGKHPRRQLLEVEECGCLRHAVDQQPPRIELVAVSVEIALLAADPLLQLRHVGAGKASTSNQPGVAA